MSTIKKNRQHSKRQFRFFQTLLIAICLAFHSIALASTFEATLRQSDAGKELLSLNPRILTDEARSEQRINIVGHDAVLEKMIDHMVRFKGRSLMLLGEPGVGKTSVVEKLAQNIVDNAIIKTGRFSEISNAEVLSFEISLLRDLDKFNPAKAALIFAEKIEAAEKATGKQIIVFLDEPQENVKFIEGLKKQLALKLGPRYIAATTLRDFALNFSQDGALVRRFSRFEVPELTVQETKEALRLSWVPTLERHYEISIPDDILELIIKRSKMMYPGVARPDGPIQALQDIAVQIHKAGGETVTETSVYEYLAKKTGAPANPTDIDAIQDHIEERERHVKSQLVGQQRMRRALLRAHQKLLMASDGKPEVIAILGLPGVGKTFMAETIAQSDSKVFSIDGADLASSEKDITHLLGPRPGKSGFGSTTGQLVDWMQGAGKYYGTLVINDAHRIHPEHLVSLGMALFEKGEVTAGNGQLVKSFGLQVILTSNRGIEHLYPIGFENWDKADQKEHLDRFTAEDLKRLHTERTSADDKSTWPTELVNRVHKWVVADVISNDEAKEILRRHIERQTKLFTERNKITLTIDANIIDFIIEQKFAPRDGARALESFAKDLVSDAAVLAKKNATVSLVKDGARKNWYFQITPEKVKKPIDWHDHPFKGVSKELLLQDLPTGNQLENLLKKDVMGQDPALEKIAEAFRGWIATKPGKPLFILALGSTGVGKSETAKSLARHGFNSEHKVEFIPLDEITSEHKLSKVFGGSPEYVGHEKFGSFEEALLKLGGEQARGVIAWEEITDVGSNKEERERILQRFKNLSELGSWTSPQTRRTYSLRNIVFLGTGNLLQDVFYEATTDQKVLDIFEAFKDEEKVRYEAREKGVPQAFLGRAEVVVMYSPLVKEVRTAVMQSLIDKSIKDITQGEFQGIQIEIDSKLAEVLAEVFYNFEQGGRSLRNAAQTKVASAIATALLDAGIDSDRAVNTTVKLRAEGDLVLEHFILTKDIKPLELVIEITEKGARKSPKVVRTKIQPEATKILLHDLKSQLDQRVFGQELLITSLVEQFRAWVMIPNGKPLVVYTDGTTGVGKTELGLALGEIAYQQKEKVQLIPLAEVANETGRNLLFGSNPGYTGNDRKGLFEKALKKLIDSDGKARGVLILDEFGDLLRNEKSIETVEALKNIFEYGEFHSPNSGKTYDLSEVVLFLTGNLTQSKYNGFTSDDRRRRRYLDLIQSGIHQVFLSAGMPETILGRIDLLAIAEPLYQEDRQRVSEKFFNEIKKGIARQYPSLNIIINDSALKTLSEVFYNSNTGGRSLRSKMESQLKAMISEAILESGITKQQADGHSVELEIEDRRSQKIYSITGVKDEVIVRVHLLKADNKILSLERNILETEAPKRFREGREFVKTAAHEIGHAWMYVKHQKTLGINLDYLSIEPGQTANNRYNGYAEASEVSVKSSTIDWLKAQLEVTVAGRVAQEVIGFQADTGWSSDLRKMKALIAQTYIYGGLDDRLLGATFNDKTSEVIGTDTHKEIFSEIVENEIKEARTKVRAYLSENLDFLRFMTAQMFRGQGNMSGTEFLALKKFYYAEELSEPERQLIERFRKNIDNKDSKITTSQRHEKRAKEIKAVGQCHRLFSL